jgi:hypothetical protein
LYTSLCIYILHENHLVNFVLWIEASIIVLHCCETHFKPFYTICMSMNVLNYVDMSIFPSIVFLLVHLYDAYTIHMFMHALNYVDMSSLPSLVFQLGNLYVA